MADSLGILDFLEILDYPGLPEILDILDKTIELAAAGCVETRKPQASVETLKLSCEATTATSREATVVTKAAG